MSGKFEKISPLMRFELVNSRPDLERQAMFGPRAFSAVIYQFHSVNIA